MIRILLLLINLFLSCEATAFTWKDLWYTPDQQGKSLMEKAQFAKAKDTFERSDWAAAAAYKAGDYERAETLFKELNTEQGFYNQGNALAHMGQYEQAIKAYDRALSFNPNNQDALYNRKIIKALLKKDKEQNKNQQNKDQQNKDQQNKDQQNKDQQNKDQQNKDQQNKDQQNKDQQSKDQQSKDQQNKDQQNQDKETTKNQQNQKQDKNKKGNKKNETMAQSEADREKQQAKEQWLRLIPDDPGGLMREKFLRDHLRRERGWYE